MAAEKINVENFEQQALLELELKGQISDGNWENSYPMDHYKQPCRAEVKIDADNLGLSYYPMRKYDFLSYDLLKIIRTRMIVLVRLAQRFGLEKAKDLEMLFETMEDCKSLDVPEYVGIPDYVMDAASKGDKWVADRMHNYDEVFANEANVTWLKEVATISIKDKKSGAYGLSKLEKDLGALKVIFSKRIRI